MLIEVRSFDKGGLEKMVLDMALRLNPNRFQVTIVSVGPVGYLAEVARRKGLTVHALDPEDPAGHFHAILENERISVVNSHFSFFGYPLLQGLGIPNVTFIHNVYAFLPAEERLLMRRWDSQVDLYVAVSDKAAKYAIHNLGLPPEKFVTIPNGLILSEHEQRRASAPNVSRSEFGIGADDYLFLNVASYNLHKGHYLMADAMQRILEVRGDIKILCLGNVIFPPHVDALKLYLKEHGLERHILMPGFFPNVESFYRIADGFLLPSFIEGWSVAMNEAMFHAKPMILTDTGAAAEVIENNDIGILLENEYPDLLKLEVNLLDSIAYDKRKFNVSSKLADAMIEMADHRDYWAAAGRRGRQKLLKHYDFDKQVVKYERVFIRSAIRRLQK